MWLFTVIVGKRGIYWGYKYIEGEIYLKFMVYFIELDIWVNIFEDLLGVVLYFIKIII